MYLARTSERLRSGRGKETAGMWTVSKLIFYPVITNTPESGRTALAKNNLGKAYQTHSRVSLQATTDHISTTKMFFAVGGSERAEGVVCILSFSKGRVVWDNIRGFPPPPSFQILFFFFLWGTIHTSLMWLIGRTKNIIHITPQIRSQCFFCICLIEYKYIVGHIVTTRVTQI